MKTVTSSSQENTRKISKQSLFFGVILIRSPCHYHDVKKKTAMLLLFTKCGDTSQWVNLLYDICTVILHKLFWLHSWYTCSNPPNFVVSFLHLLSSFSFFCLLIFTISFFRNFQLSNSSICSIVRSLISNPFWEKTFLSSDYYYVLSF